MIAGTGMLGCKATVDTTGGLVGIRMLSLYWWVRAVSSMIVLA